MSIISPSGIAIAHKPKIKKAASAMNATNQLFDINRFIENILGPFKGHYLTVFNNPLC
jgi:hypothetical protein